MKRLFFLCALLGLGSFAGEARADSPNNDWDGGYQQVSTRRSGFMLGISTGLALGRAYGYPNEIAKLDVPRYKRNTAFALGGSKRLWLGGALTDWFVFGFGLEGISLKRDNITAAGSAYTFHVEGYPLFYRGGVFRDLSLFGDFGAGGMKISGNGREDANGGFMSVMGFGAGWDPVRFWHFNFGPAVEYTHVWSQTLTADSFALEARLTFIGGP
jgi:hypothetical protein